MDLETFLTTVYVLVDDWYKEQIAPHRPPRGRPAEMSDSEVLTVALASVWRSGTPWQSQRGAVRYLRQHGRCYFPSMVGLSAFNERMRNLYGVLVQWQLYLAHQLYSAEHVYECVDSVPLPAGTLGQYARDAQHGLADSTLGRGPHGFFWGDHWLVSVTSQGAITGWLVGAAHLNDRWLLEGLVSARAGYPQLIGPPWRPRDGKKGHIAPPIGFMGGWAAVGVSRSCPYLADQGFNGHRWLTHWARQFHATVLAVPPDNSQAERPWTRAAKLWLASHRQIVDTVFSRLDAVFAIKRLAVHSRWGQLAKLAAIAAAYNMGLFINRMLGRPLLSHETLIC